MEFFTKSRQTFSYRQLIGMWAFTSTSTTGRSDLWKSQQWLGNAQEGLGLKSKEHHCVFSQPSCAPLSTELLRRRKNNRTTQNSCRLLQRAWMSRREYNTQTRKGSFRPTRVRWFVCCSPPQAEARAYRPSRARGSDPTAPGQPSAEPPPPLRPGTFSRPSPAALEARCRSARPAGERKGPPAPPPRVPFLVL